MREMTKRLQAIFSSSYQLYNFSIFAARIKTTISISTISMNSMNTRWINVYYINTVAFPPKQMSFFSMNIWKTFWAFVILNNKHNENTEFYE